MRYDFTEDELIENMGDKREYYFELKSEFEKSAANDTLEKLKELNKHANIQVLAQISGLTKPTLYRIDRHPEDHSLKLKTIIKIHDATKRLYGHGLTPDQYLKNIPF